MPDNGLVQTFGGSAGLPGQRPGQAACQDSGTKRISPTKPKMAVVRPGLYLFHGLVWRHAQPRHAKMPMFGGRCSWFTSAEIWASHQRVRVTQ